MATSSSSTSRRDENAPGLPSAPAPRQLPQSWEGMFALTGPGVRSGVELSMQNPLCTAPLVAYLLGLDVALELPCVASGEFANSVLPAIFMT